ncbi:MAG: Tfx family DNA-binding protein [Euryarchaeota archaeon]|nr:Tfx family DNA-binding protein [Euryarchaeota archaeon]
MEAGTLTERQKEILRYRRAGYTQQQIADIVHTTKANVSLIEKAANENIQRAYETLEFMNTLDAIHLCTLEKGNDLVKAAESVIVKGDEHGISVKYDLLDLCNKVRDKVPDSVRGRLLRADIEVYLRDDGEIFLE